MSDVARDKTKAARALIAVYGSEGLIGRCDANCYEGADSRCE